MNVLSVGSLFSGIGGFELGLERTGCFKTKWQCEIDPFCLKVLAKHWLDVKRFTDIKKMGVEEEIPYVDVICGGFPCQDISCAGKGAGIHAERSGLWWEMLRVVRLVGPKYVIVENVAALLVRGIEEVLGSLAEIGYDIEGASLCASDLGSFHRRERIFIVAYPTGERLEKANVFCKNPKESCTEKPIEWKQFLTISAGAYHIDERWKEYQDRICRDDDGLSRKLDKDRFRSLGNAIVPQCAQYVGQCLLDSIKEA